MSVFETWEWEGNKLCNSAGDVLLECTQGPSDSVSRIISTSPFLLASCEAAMLLADEDVSLPDNGEYSGDAIGDQISSAIAIAKGEC